MRVKSDKLSLDNKFNLSLLFFISISFYSLHKCM